MGKATIVLRPASRWCATKMAAKLQQADCELNMQVGKSSLRTILRLGAQGWVRKAGCARLGAQEAGGVWRGEASVLQSG